MKKVSIIIPAYNVEHTLGAAIESAISQTWSNTEIIVVNDGSPDQSLQVAKSYENQDIRVIDQVNAGACAARNNGFTESTGDYIQFLDGDDILDKEKISHQMELLAGDEARVSHCPWAKFENTPDYNKIEHQPINRNAKPIDFLVDMWNGKGMMQTACWLVPRRIALAAGAWDQRSTVNDDGDYFCRVSLASQEILYAEQSIVFYRNPLESNVSQQKSEAALAGLLYSYERYEEAALKIDQSPRVKSALANNYFRFVYMTYPKFPDLCDKALQNTKRLEVDKPNAVGGATFLKMVSVIGFKNAMKLRRLIG